MKSPFPGMDPYLESSWSDVHVKLIGFIGEALTPLLPKALRARSEERVMIEAEDEGDRLSLRKHRADVAVVRAGRGNPPRRAKRNAFDDVPEPFVIEYEDAPRYDRFVKIIDVRNGNRLVTAIEVLSPGNKARGRLNDQYLKKLDDYAAAGVSVVEIDLLRSSRERLPVTEIDLSPEGRTPYLICVHKAWRPARWEAYPVDLRRPIPPVHIPLRPGDDEVILRLQPLIDRVYAASGYDDTDYSRPPVPSLSAEDDKWADELLRKAKLRKGPRRGKAK